MDETTKLVTHIECLNQPAVCTCPAGVGVGVGQVEYYCEVHGGDK